MTVLMLLLVLAVIGVITWALVTYLPMPAPIKTVMIVVAVIVCVLYALHAFGIHLPNPSVPTLR